MRYCFLDKDFVFVDWSNCGRITFNEKTRIFFDEGCMELKQEQSRAGD